MPRRTDERPGTDGQEAEEPGNRAKERRTEAARQLALVEAWNAAHEPGVSVTVTLDNRQPFATRTRSKAELLSGHTAVVWLEGVSGCYLLERCNPNQEAGASGKA